MCTDVRVLNFQYMIRYAQQEHTEYMLRHKVCNYELIKGHVLTGSDEKALRSLLDTERCVFC